MPAEHNEYEVHPTIRKMEEATKALFPSPGVPQPDIEPEKVHWTVKLKQWVLRLFSYGR